MMVRKSRIGVQSFLDDFVKMDGLKKLRAEDDPFLAGQLEREKEVLELKGRNIVKRNR